MKSLVLGKKNVVSGWLLILVSVILGLYLEIKLGDPSWGTGDSRVLRKLLKDAHAHALGLAFLNILYGLIVDRISLTPGIVNQGAWLAIIGSWLFPLSMFLTIFNPPLFYGTFVAGFFMLIAIWIILVGCFRD